MLADRTGRWPPWEARESIRLACETLPKVWDSEFRAVAFRCAQMAKGVRRFGGRLT